MDWILIALTVIVVWACALGLFVVLYSVMASRRREDRTWREDW